MMIGGHIIKALHWAHVSLRSQHRYVSEKKKKKMPVNTFTGIEIKGTSNHCKCLTCCRCVSALRGQFPVNDDIMYGEPDT